MSEGNVDRAMPVEPETKSEPKPDDARAKIEAEAREQGWVPKEEFRGPEDQWRDAGEFLERGKQINPILRKHNEELKARAERTEQKLTELTEQISEQRKTFEQFMSHRDKVLEAEYSRKLKDLKRKMRAAVEEGNVEEFDNLQEELEVVESTKPAPPSKEEPKDEGNSSPPPDPVMEKWIADNSWYATDPSMRAAADAYGAGLRVTNPGLVGEAFLNAVTEQMKKIYPDKFGNPMRKVGSGVEETTPGPSPTGGSGETYEDLPAEAKAICDRFVKEELMTRDQYVKEYFSQEGGAA